MGLPVRVGGKITAADINNIAGLPVASFADLPGSGNWLGREICTLDTGIKWQWNGTQWVVTANGTRVISIINAGGTIVSASFADKLTTTDLPLTVQVDAEQITITACTSATPQVATITRGANGTTAAAHLANAAVTVLPDSIYAF